MTRRPRRASPEMQLHVAVADYLRHALRPPTIWTTFPAGGGGKARGGKLKAMGLQPGWPDIIVMHPKGYWTRVVGIELKTTAGTISEAQRAMLYRFGSVRAIYHVCRSVEAVEASLGTCGIPLHATVLPARAA